MLKISFYEYSGFNHQGALVDDLSLLPISKKQIEYLSKISETVISGENIFSITSNKIKANSIVGVISFDNIQIEILPKLLKKEENQNNQMILQNLMFMLSYTNQLDIHNSGLGLLSKENDSFIEAYISIFANTLMNRLLRHGAPKKYLTFRENSNFVKGRILFGPNLSINGFNQSKVFCEYSELTENNSISQAFKFVSHNLLKLTQNTQNFVNLQKCIGLLEGVDYAYVRPEDLDKQSVTAKDQNFIALLNLTKMFLKKLRPNFSNHNNTKVFSLLFDMNQLFEEFVFKVLKMNESRLNIKVSFQKGKRLVTAERDYLLDNTWEEKKIFNTFTDIIVEKANKKKIIIDTKYKIVDPTFSHYGIKNDDVYQILTYKQLYELQDESACVLLLYPKFRTEIKKEFKLNSQSKNSFFTYTLDLSSDLNSKTNMDLILSNLQEFIDLAG